MAFEDLTGRKFGRLTAVKYLGGDPTQWECTCDCGKTSKPRTHDLKIGKAQSCGCLRRELAAARRKDQ